MQKRYLHNAFDAKIVWNSIWLYKSSYPVHFTAGNINMLSAKGFFFTLKKKKASYKFSAYFWEQSVRINEVNLRWESVDWASNKYAFSALTGMRQRIQFRENCKGFSGGRKLSVTTRSP